MPDEPTPDERWYRTLTQGDDIPKHLIHLLRLLPSSPRCKMCNAPFKGWGGSLMSRLGRGQSRYNPRFCQPCEQFETPGGAEIVLTMFFADVRNSTRLAETMSALEFSRLINRFYATASDVLVNADAMVDRLMGDQVIGLFIPGMAGPNHPRRAVQAARRLLQLTGHRNPSGPWLSVGIGIHTALAFVGVVGGEAGSPNDFTALGDNVNVTARLSSLAGPGEILISEATCAVAGLDVSGLEQRFLELKGKSGLTGVRVMRVSPG